MHPCRAGLICPIGPWPATLALAAIVALSSGPVAAHGLGERYDLPLPLGLYLTGAAATVALSFVLLALTARAEPMVAMVASGGTVRGWRLPDRFAAAQLALVARIVSLALFGLLMAAGILGSPDPFKNPLPVSVWVLGWVGLAYVNALVGNVWAVINPWDNAFRCWEWLAKRTNGAPAPLMAYPAWLEAWPAVALFGVFAWLELVWPARDHPASLAAVMLAYSVLTWTGMALFGRQTWLERCEFLTIAFGLLARFAILDRHNDSPDAPLSLRPPAIGLLVDRAVAPSLAAFALLMLSTVTFDGLLETPLWAALAEQGMALPLLRAVGDIAGLSAYLLLVSAALLVFPLIFAAAYLLVARIMVSLVAETAVTTSEMARLFVLTLIPIAIGYHLSHYLSYLLVAGQFIIPIASDPFALGWNMFGTKLYLIDFSVIDARLIWLLSLVLIVGGHVIAVWLAHEQARRRFVDRRTLLRSQAPMLVLMVGYTALSLWILAQPIVEA